MPENPSNSHAAGAGAAVEAARYALLRRLAPALRHEAVAHLQPLAMVGSVLERRLAQSQHDAAQVADGVRRLLASSRGAIQSCLDVIAWLAPEPDRWMPLHESVAEALQLLHGNLGLRGFTVRDEIGGCDVPVPREALRYVLPASLLWLTDSAGPPAEVSLHAQAEDSQVQVRLALTPTDGPEGLDAAPAWRPLRREEVLALAQAEGIGWTHEGDLLTLCLPLARREPQETKKGPPERA